MAEAQVMLGNLLFELTFPPQDNTKAYMWMSIAASRGDQVAAKRLRFFRIFMFSEHLVKGEQMALDWRRAFEARKTTPQTAGSDK